MCKWQMIPLLEVFHWDFIASGNRFDENHKNEVNQLRAGHKT